MSGSGNEKCVGLEIRKIDTSGAATFDQFSCNQWMVAPHSPFQIIKHYRKLQSGGMLTDWDWGQKLVDDEAQVDFEIYEGFERGVFEELVSLGVVDALAGISVYEVLFYGKNGIIFKSPRRFLVLQSSNSVALFSCSSLNLAWSTALALSTGAMIPADVKRIGNPLPPRLDLTPRR
ncbi:hypothetical protein [Xanthomonas sp. 1678]|uniref:hypothetical protein n=1 Tax=Xanthomonas sp. 1678 TaxID=3158788 RepID=UPI00285F7223|nr:hypothetical protein [Xanthomonas translucens]